MKGYKSQRWYVPATPVQIYVRVDKYVHKHCDLSRREREFHHNWLKNPNQNKNQKRAIGKKKTTYKLHLQDSFRASKHIEHQRQQHHNRSFLLV